MEAVAETSRRNRDADVAALKALTGTDLSDTAHLIKGIGQGKDGTVTISLNLDEGLNRDD